MIDFNRSQDKFAPPTDDSSCFELVITEGIYNISAQLDLFRESKTLIVAFHGNIKQSINPYPVYQKEGLSKRLESSVLSIADPTLQNDTSLGIGWYLGFRDFPAQKILIEFIKNVIDLYNFERIVFMGGSGGGFAALFFSYHFPSSIALVANPQVILASDGEEELPRAGRLQKVIERNFNGSVSNLCLNLCDLYKSQIQNYVIYLQNGECTSDVQYHASPFLSNAISESPENIIMKFDYWGIKGHSGSVPFPEFMRWVHAINSVREINKGELYSHYFEVDQSPENALSSSKNINQRFLQISDILGGAKL